MALRAIMLLDWKAPKVVEPNRQASLAGAPLRCRMHSGLALLEAAPGREASVLSRLARVPEVAASQLLFGPHIALRLSGSPGSLPRAVARMRKLAGVREVRFYPGKHA